MSEMRSSFERLDARLVDFLAQYSKEEMAAITLGLAPIETECYRLWARSMTLAGRETPEMTKEQAVFAGLLSALAWEYPSEKTAGPIQLAPRTIIYPEETERVVDFKMAGRETLLLP
jgi:hypothetical protein